MTAAAVVPEWVFGGRLVRCGMPHPIWRTDCFTLVTCHPVTLCLGCVVCIKTCPLNGLCSTPTIAGGVPTGSPPLNKKKLYIYRLLYNIYKKKTLRLSLRCWNDPSRRKIPNGIPTTYWCSSTNCKYKFGGGRGKTWEKSIYYIRRKRENNIRISPTLTSMKGMEGSDQ